jgi:hypothetical protein
LLGLRERLALVPVVAPIPWNEFAALGGFPIHEKALLHDLEADSAGHLQQGCLLGVALAGFAHLDAGRRIWRFCGFGHIVVGRGSVRKVFEARRAAVYVLCSGHHLRNLPPVLA